MSKQTVVTVDAFADRPFTGNPAAVCILDRARPDEWMQNVAIEMNLAETAFLQREGDAFRLRWFSPAMEIDLCGHATLASAHVLWQTGVLPRGTRADFDTRSGRLTAVENDGWITLDFPIKPVQPAETPARLLEALGVDERPVVRNQFDYLVEVTSERDVRAVRPDFGMLAEVSMRGVIVTARSDDEKYDFVSRFFAPAAGVNEDPVTGSAHCALAPYWAAKLGKTSMLGYQASSRGGFIRVELKGDRVLLSGKAITMLKGELVE